MKLLLAPLRMLYCAYAFVIFVVLMIIVIPFVVVGSFLGKVRGGNLIYRLCSLWADAWFFCIGIFHRNLYESPHSRNKPYIFVANHISYLDAPIIVKTIRQPVRVLGKVEMSYIPLFGFIYKNAIVTVDRGNAAKKAISVRILKSVVKKKISILMFPEGTFNETSHPLKSFYDGAFRIAIETQTPIKPILFLDAYDRLHYKSVFTLTPGRSRSVFLDEVSVEGLTLKDLPRLKERVYVIMSDALRKYKASWIRDEVTVA
jgi:1-acyl-sn-glycerol-3-phosphate acyltransferase